MRELIAVETAKGIAEAISEWVGAFESLGIKVSGGERPVWWIEDLGVWIKSRGEVGAKGKYWNALGTELTPEV
ncbi:hypothetical protein [Rhizobium sullae]|uniref:Uncharacterized protein n=1 Tax=Rhizobium sullae TaxID=50338 RepID=A0A4R3Q3W9_RHISU|nr:hypothetical protein [Rhizobium sullae]TCU15114.1 hypothetical protein EV132_10713 [Rhizobium sullae]